ncbi:putative quinol monooxygenase [Candidatus Laterigemmans baculatus]|uniref:putative quinol monooxygenase n=1 Tax=Candidatus Laterigemmans baculatus TaxID=2770505 RepID=UPI0013DB44CA|nr:putative quinol monooxygenase [Candidatus Laterigemmans baculatus]
MSSTKQPTFAVAVTFEIHPEHVEAFRARILKQAHDSVEKEPGCCQFDVLTDEADPTSFFLYETYLDAEAFEAHQKTPHFADYNRTVADWVKSKHLRRLVVRQSG